MRGCRSRYDETTNESLADYCSELLEVADSEMNHSGGDRLPLPVGTPDSLTVGLPEKPAKSGDGWRIFLASLWKLARQKYYWSPTRFTRIVWTMVRNIPTQIRVLRVLSRPAYKQL